MIGKQQNIAKESLDHHAARVWYPRWILAAIVLGGFALRIWGIGYGLPYTYRPDEPTYIAIALNMLKTGDLNPHLLGYPSILFYLNALIYGIYFLIGRAVHVFATPVDLVAPEIVTMGVGRELTPNLLLLGRSLSAIFGTGCILLTYLVGRKLSARPIVGILAAVLVAVSPTAIASSQNIAPDIFALFFVLVSVLGAIEIGYAGSMASYVIAGVGAGLATSSKYNAALVILAMVAAHFLRYGMAGFRRRELYIGLAACIASFFLASPFVILDFRAFLETFGLNANIYLVTGHAGQEGNSPQWYVSYLLGTEGIYVLLGLLEGWYLLYSRSKPGLTILIFPVVYFVTVSSFVVRNERTIMLIVPLAALTAGLLVAQLQEKATQLHFPRLGVCGALVATAFLLLLTPIQSSLAADVWLNEPDGRESARQWLEAKLPVGARVALEAYSPYLDTRRFTVFGIDAIVDRSLDWYVQNGFEYLVFSQGMYGRFFDDPTLYAIWVAKYNAFFARFPEIKRFDDNGYEVRVYKTGAVLPPHRVAARFGNYGEVIELVGYDVASLRWMPGEPLTVKLYWRTLADKSQPLETSLRLVDRNNRETGSARGDLFQGKGWQEGIFETDWTLPTNADAAPGVYRLDVGIVQTQYTYSLPAKTWAGDNIDQVALGPFKISVLPPTANELQAVRQANVRFGDEIALLGYARFGDARAGNSLPVTLYWQALAKPTHDYTVFVHLLDSDGKVVAQIDAQPRGGAYPTSIWDAGEIVRDDYALKLPADLAPGSYCIELGLYEYPRLARLPVADANGSPLGDHWVLPDSIQVVQ